MTVKKSIIIICLTKHIFGGPYMRQLLTDSAKQHDRITLMGWADKSNVDSEIANTNLSEKVKYTKLYHSKSGFYESIIIGIVFSFIRLLILLRRSDKVIAVGFRAAIILLCIRIYKRKVSFDYYCLEVYNKINVKHNIITHLQKSIVRAATNVIVQCNEREKLLQDHVTVNFKTKFHPNIALTELTPSQITEIPRRTSECVYSGATNASWAQNNDVLNIIKNSGLKITTRDRTQSKYLEQEKHNAFLREFGFAVAIYNSAADMNIIKLGYSSGKINTYLANGIPVFINDSNKSYVSLIERYKCGCVIQPFTTNIDEVSHFIQHVNSNRENIKKKCIKAAREIASYNTIFEET